MIISSGIDVGFIFLRIVIFIYFGFVYFRIEKKMVKLSCLYFWYVFILNKRYYVWKKYIVEIFCFLKFNSIGWIVFICFIIYFFVYVVFVVFELIFMFKGFILAS